MRHESKLKLLIERPDFSLGQDNPWPEVFEAFSTQISAHTGEMHKLMVANFSTTGPTEKAATEILLMDSFQAYFEYELRGGCGIPEITLLGTVDDWKSIVRRTQLFSEFGLEHWTDILLPVLRKISEAANGHEDVGFWNSIFRHKGGSRGEHTSGWLQTFSLTCLMVTTN